MTPVGRIYLLGGMNDPDILPGNWTQGLRAAGLPHEIVPFVWQQRGWSSLTFADLWDVARHREKAALLAKAIAVDHRAVDPRRTHVLAHSAGTAVATYALEMLPADCRVESAILVGSALAPDYDLTAALDATGAGILAVHSLLDMFHLGVGTSIFGTADRQFRPAAGMVGFEPRASYAGRLRRLQWHPRHVEQGWIGEHLSQGMSRFAEKTLAAEILQAERLGNGLRAKTQSSTG